MLFGIPQTARDKHTGRVKKLRLEAEDAADEIFLTALEEALVDAVNNNPASMTVTTASGRELEYRFREGTVRE